jgi:hypothetical protein
MRRAGNGTPYERNRGRRRTRPLLTAMAALAALFSLSPSTVPRRAADGRRDGPRYALGGAQTVAGAPSVASSDSSSARPTGVDLEKTVAPQTAPAPPTHPRSEMDALVSRTQRMQVITAAGATDIHRVLRGLREQGTAAVPAIGEFLRDGEDIDFAKKSGGEQVGYRTLRQAMIDTLETIGGSEATSVSLEQLQRTTEPIEMVMMARAVDREEPGIHRGEVIDAIGDALQSAEQAPAKASPDVAPLFDLLRTFGGEQAVTTLEASVPQWGEYAVIALAGLPEGAGISSLAALAGSADGPMLNPVLPFQMLAQATAQYPEAGDALVGLAAAGQIPDDAWDVLGQALGGKHLEFPAKMFDGTPLSENGMGTSRGGASPSKSYYVEWLNVRYEEDVVSANWSADQVEQQLALIDDLLDATSTPAAVQALQQARASLQRGHRT